jgi:type IV secretion system protein VirB9
LREYQSTGVARPVTLGAGVSYPFGHGTPLLMCAVLRVCLVELERGEMVVDEPLAGDQARWIIQTARAGPGGRDALVVVKPTACDLATNLVIPTDRRVYDLSLESAPCDVANPRMRGASLTRRVSFYYPDGPTASTWMGGLDARLLPHDQRLADTGTAGSRTTGTTRNDRYRVVRARRGPFGLFGRKPLDFPWTPRTIVDDGERVYVVAPADARPHGAPLLYALEDDGSRTIVNVAVRGDTLISDRTFRRGVLVLAAGNREQRLTFENRAWGARPALASPSAAKGDTASSGRRGQ